MIRLETLAHPNSGLTMVRVKIYGIAWRRTPFSADRPRKICEYGAPDAESVSKAQSEAGNPFHCVWLGMVIE